jgi:Domain of unknown function (DUF4157)
VKVHVPVRSSSKPAAAADKGGFAPPPRTVRASSVPPQGALHDFSKMAPSSDRQTSRSQRGSGAVPPNRTGLPDRLKAGVESLSGLSLDDVRVHYNSPKPAGVRARAYTQGAHIHLAPGQQEHLPHEAWHVVQQKQPG